MAMKAKVSGHADRREASLSDEAMDRHLGESETRRDLGERQERPPGGK